MVWQRPTDPTNEEMGKAASACSSAAWSLRIAATRATTASGAPGGGDVAEVDDPAALDTRESCLDAADELEALTRLLGRPYRPGRAVALRRLLLSAESCLREPGAGGIGLGHAFGARIRGSMRPAGRLRAV